MNYEVGQLVKYTDGGLLGTVKTIPDESTVRIGVLTDGDEGKPLDEVLMMCLPHEIKVIGVNLDLLKKYQNALMNKAVECEQS